MSRSSDEENAQKSGHGGPGNVGGRTEGDARLRAILDGIDEAAYLVDFDWRYLYVNEAAARFSRSTPSEMLGRRLMDVHDDADQRPIFRFFEKCMEERVPQDLEEPWTYPDGRTVWYEIRLQPHPEGLFIRSRDITERKLAEESVKALQARLGAVFRASPLPILALDVDANVILWSPAAERVFGWTEAELRGKPNPIVPEELVAELREILASPEGVTNLATARMSRGGRRIPVRLSAAPMWGSNGERTGTVVTLVDVTEQHALRNALVESEQRFAAVFNESPIGKVLVRSDDRCIVEVNRSFLRLFGMKREQVIEKPTTVLPYDRRTFDLEHFWRELRKAGRVTDYPIEIAPAGGNMREAVVSAELITMGEQEYALVAVQDVTARRQMERALRESDERFRQISGTIEEVFWLSDVDKNAILYVSPAYERIWGRAPASLLENPRQWVEAVHEEDRERVLHAARTKQVLGTYDEEYRIVRPNGELRWIRDRGFPVRDAAGRVYRIAGAARDITAERDLELQLRQTQKMESIGLLAGGVAHDFNNLLTVISGNCDLMAETGEKDSDGRVLVEEIRDAATRAASLTRQLLSFSRREVVEPRVVALHAAIIETEKMLRRLLGEDIILTLDLAGVNPRVKVDPGSFGQLLMNLAVNARDAMPSGGDLRIATRVVTLTEEQRRAHPSLAQGPYVRLSVVDTGKGIPPEIASRIFEPFFTTKGLGRGTGLGLSVVHGIVAQSGGFIDVESVPGEGASFHTYIPVADASSCTSAPSVRGVAAPGSGTVLFVEDEAGIRRVAARALRRSGFTLLEASDGEHALELARNHPGRIDLLITDVVMPKMSGREVADALRKAHPDMHVLYTSGFMDDAVLSHGVRHAEVAFLPKPYDLISLRRKVRRVLERGADEEVSNE